MATRAPKRPRRTQAERRASTRAALLDATVQSLIERGYADTTTRDVAERAGVSQGALQYHFPTKFALFNAAVLRLVEQYASNALTDAGSFESSANPAAVALDALWEIHCHPIAAAVYEAFAIARTDPEIAGAVAGLLERMIEVAVAAGAALLPARAKHARFREMLLISFATIRGAAIVATIPGAENAHADWPTTRRFLLDNLDALARP